jgi:crotonobetainyl-CoA:carnitine CoA-transferase CaiB-like acyl-CoA transferase
LILSELGADVVKIEDPRGGDPLRHFPQLKGKGGGAFYSLNRGKRSVAIDLKADAGRELFLRLLPGFQVVIESFRPGVMARLGLGYGALRAASPRLILCSITGYGQTGPLEGAAGHDINYLALSGALAAGGDADGDPCLPGVQIADIAGGALWAGLRILAALHAGGGVHLDVSMTEGTLAFLLPWLGDLAVGGGPSPPRGRGPLTGGSALYNVYPTADGGHVAVGALEPKFSSALLSELSLSPGDAADGPAAVDGPAAEDGPVAEEVTMQERMRRRFKSAARDGWAERFAAVDACVTPVLEMEELADHPLHRHRRMFFTLEDPARGPLELLRLPLDQPPSTSPAPELGQHTDQLLAEEGVSGEEIRALRRAGVVA